MKRMATWLFSSCALLAAPTMAEVLPESGPLAKQSVERLLLIDAKRLGNRIVAVGDRGYIIYSDDNGESWQRAKAPAGPLLTALHFADDKTGWAVGHDSVILATSDGGLTWTKQFSAESDKRPLLDVLFLDKLTGFAVGAYGAFFETADGGKTWSPRNILKAPVVAPAKAKGKGSLREPAAEPTAKLSEDRHLNGIIKLKDGKLLIVGEGGTMLDSDDAGKTWSRIASPYKGSFFGAVQAADGGVIIYGLRGHLFRNANGNLKEWKAVSNTSTASLMGSTRLTDGTLAIVGGSGVVLVSRDNGASFSLLPSGTTKAFSKVLLGAPNSLLLLGEVGARDVLLSAASR